ncbi:hypothetical protein RRG08_038798 [Elysia crispata]|nr:hypothetical protein RRG08_038798 [Elysia crispata]
MGPEAERIYSTFELAEGDRTFDTVLSKFDEHFIPQRNIIHLRAQFHRREQQSKETIEEYIRALYELSEHANFPNKEDYIRDQLVLGVRDKELSEKLQLKADLSLKEAITTARQYKTVKHELSEQRDQAQPADLNRVQRNKPTSYNRPSSSSYPKTKSTTRSTSQHGGSQQRTNCGKCGKNRHYGKCPAFGKECHKCGRRNHFAKLFRSKTRARADQLQEELGYQEGTREVNVDNTEFFIDSITDTTSAPWRVDLKLEGSTVSFKIDTGADDNVLSESSWKSLPLKPRLHPARIVHLSSPGGKLDIKGKFISKINKQTATFYVVNNDVECLLSRDTSTALGLMSKDADSPAAIQACCNTPARQDVVTLDTLSRSPAACSQETSNLHEDVHFHVSMVTSSWLVSDGKLRQLKEETQQDANGETEKAVRSAKEFLRQNDPHLALLTYRTTPLPALGAYGRRLRTTLPAVPQTLSPRPVNHDLIPNRNMANKALQKKYFDRKTCHLPDLEPGDQVLLKKEEGGKGWNQPGKVVRQCAPRSYIVSTPDGQLRRNRKHLMLQKTQHKNHPEGGLQTAPVPQEPAPPIPWPVQSPRQISVIRPASPVEPSHQPEPSSSSPVSARAS